MKKTVDVIIPVYNCEQFVSQAINSALEQTYQPRQVIVIDDGSSDGTAEVVKALQKKHSNLTYTKTENSGPSAARNLGARMSTADYISFLDSDDYWHAQKLEKQVAIFEKNTDPLLGIVYCSYSIRDDSEKTKGFKTHLCAPYVMKRGKIDPFDLYKNKGAFTTPGLLIRRDIFWKLNGYDETLRCGEDTDFLLKFCIKYTFDFVPDDLVTIRVHDFNTTKRIDYSFIHFIAFYNRYPEIIAASGEDKPLAHHLAHHAIRRLPKLDYYRLIRDGFNSNTKSVFFRKTGGNFHFFLILTFFKMAYNYTRKRLIRSFRTAAMF